MPRDVLGRPVREGQNMLVAHNYERIIVAKVVRTMIDGINVVVDDLTDYGVNRRVKSADGLMLQLPAQNITTNSLEDFSEGDMVALSENNFILTARVEKLMKRDAYVLLDGVIPSVHQGYLSSYRYRKYSEMYLLTDELEVLKVDYPELVI